MKRNSFYILLGIVALIEVAFFWWAVEMREPLLMSALFIIGVLVVYLAKKEVSEVMEDERTILINQKAALRTLEVFWVVFFAMSISAVVIGLGRTSDHPGHVLPPPDPRHVGFFGMAQLALLCLMIFLYVGFRIYYSRQYGGWDTDEEQD